MNPNIVSFSPNRYVASRKGLFLTHFGCSVVLLVLVVILNSCQSLVEVDAPKDSINQANVFGDDGTAAAVLTGIYAKISRGNSSGLDQGEFTSLSVFPSLSADELTLYDLNEARYAAYYTNSLVSQSGIASADYWSNIYPVIFVANSALEGLTASTTLTPAVKQQLLGEARFVRAFCYFYLVNLYGGVPLVTSTDWQVNASRGRATTQQVYQQIIADLQEAKNLLGTDYLNGTLTAVTTEKVRPTRWGAAAMLARAYLYTGDWANAEIEATSVIAGPFGLETLNSAFLKNNMEAIWQLFAVGVDANANTGEGKFFILPPSGPAFNYPVYLSADLVSSFEAGDLRMSSWVDTVDVAGTVYYYPFKYKIGAVAVPNAEYTALLRLGEVYLIRAEARAQLGNVGGAASDLDMIRSRAGLPNTTAATQPALLTAIEQERRVELFTEYGHRWLDLKRTNRVDAVMTVVTPQKGGTWSPFKALYPIPDQELQRALQLSQNPGY